MFPAALRHQDELPQAPAWVLSTQLPSLVAAGRVDDADAATSFVEAVTDARGASADGASFIALARGMVIFEGLVRRARGWAALVEGRRSAAIELFLDASDWARAHGQHTAELFALHDALRLGASDAAPMVLDRGSRPGTRRSAARRGRGGE